MARSASGKPAAAADDERTPRKWATTPATRRRILSAALSCFDTNGVSGTTIDDICTAAELSVGSIYHHFSGKDDIVETLVHEATAEYRTGIVDALQGGKKLEQSIRQMVHFHVQWAETRPMLTRLMLRWEEGERDRPSGRDHYREYSESIGAWLRRQAQAGSIRRMEPDLYAALFMGPLMEHARERSAGLTTSTADALEAGLVDGLLRVLGP